MPISFNIDDYCCLVVSLVRCCPCGAKDGKPGGAKGALPLICLVPRDAAAGQGGARGGGGGHTSGQSGGSACSGGMPDSQFQFLDEEYLKKHFNLPPRALYLDPFRRPLITFPVSGENTKNFNMARKTKINQQILDGFLDPSEAITAPSVFPYAEANKTKTAEEAEEDEEIIYILQLPDWEFKCPIHKETIRTPRFIWHSCKKSKKGKGEGEMRQGGGPLNRPKPWLLSRHTDFDWSSQW
ncbi:uncharacterized protein LOC126380206 [Pectinophora gossypiella]|uniref:uncharacterized protein LOC126380206 n=1 Tax=Pectinophora gossypiella TaxID=13191 RepID=UPI00214DF45C|nr:uncharacterized protein LOC126380206 [Pectinophora gossypiella]